LGSKRLRLGKMAEKEVSLYDMRTFTLHSHTLDLTKADRL